MKSSSLTCKNPTKLQKLNSRKYAAIPENFLFQTCAKRVTKEEDMRRRDKRKREEERREERKREEERREKGKGKREAERKREKEKQRGKAKKRRKEKGKEKKRRKERGKEKRKEIKEYQSSLSRNRDTKEAEIFSGKSTCAPALEYIHCSQIKIIKLNN
jgi:hypothetical protein